MIAKNKLENIIIKYKNLTRKDNYVMEEYLSIITKFITNNFELIIKAISPIITGVVVVYLLSFISNKRFKKHENILIEKDMNTIYFMILRLSIYSFILVNILGKYRGTYLGINQLIFYIFIMLLTLFSIFILYVKMFNDYFIRAYIRIKENKLIIALLFVTVQLWIISLTTIYFNLVNYGNVMYLGLYFFALYSVYTLAKSENLKRVGSVKIIFIDGNEGIGKSVASYEEYVVLYDKETENRTIIYNNQIKKIEYIFN